MIPSWFLLTVTLFYIRGQKSDTIVIEEDNHNKNYIDQVKFLVDSF